jgi:hypothetical protein
MPNARPRAADPAEAHDPEALAGELGAGEGLPVPLLGLHRGVGRRDVPREREHEADRELGGRERVAARRVHHEDAAPRRRREVDVVDAHAATADHLQALRRLDDLGVHLGAAADEDRVVGGHDLHELGGRQGLLHVDGPAFAAQDLGAAFGDPLEDEDAVTHVQFLSLKNDCGTGPGRAGARGIIPLCGAGAPLLALMTPSENARARRAARNAKNGSTQTVENPVESPPALRTNCLHRRHFVHSALRDSSVTEGHAICVTEPAERARM